MTKNTVVINGKLYDANTGLPIVDTPKPAPVVEKIEKVVVKSPTPRPTHSMDFVDELGKIVAGNPAPAKTGPTAVDRVRTQRVAPVQNVKKPARSRTLNRQFVSKPAGKVVNYRARTSSAPVATSPMVSKFAKNESAAVKLTVRRAAEPAAAKLKPVTQPTVGPIAKTFAPVPDRPAVKPDIVARAEQKHSVQIAKNPVVAKPANSRELKNALIREQMEKPHMAKDSPRKKRKFSALSIASAAFVVVLLGGYFTYVNMPSLSVRVAASRAGVNAKYPNYNPNGYHLDGPVAFAPGQVMLHYKSNTDNERYSITQQNSSWDSSAVLENKVGPDTANYQTLSQKGLTIYRYDDKAAWVNGGVLYTIDGDASLSTEQVLRIVDSI